MEIRFARPKPEAPLPTSVRIAMALAGTLLAVVVGAIVWAVWAYFTERAHESVAVFLGIGITLAFLLPFRPISRVRAVILFLPCALLTLASIFLGQYVLVVLMAIRDSGYSPLAAIDLVSANATKMLNTPATAVALFLGCVGSILGYLYVLRRSRPSDVGENVDHF